MAVEMAWVNDFNLVALEINASCPNTGADLIGNTAKIIAGCQRARELSRFPLILKLSVVHDVELILPEIKRVVEAVSINSVSWKVIFPNKQSPLAHLGGGGVSGRIAQPFTWKMVKRIADVSSIPVIGSSVWEFEDIERLRDIGASAISFGSIFTRHPCLPTTIVKKDMKKNQASKI